MLTELGPACSEVGAENLQRSLPSSAIPWFSEHVEQPFFAALQF